MSKVEDRTIEEMLEDMKDVRVKAIMSPEMKKDMLGIAKLMVDSMPEDFIEDHEGSKHMLKGAKGLIIKLEESLETSDLSLTVPEASFIETLLTLIDVEMPGLQVVDKDTGVIVGSQKNPENVGMNISDVYTSETIH
jgi:hypothetical protein